MRTGHVSACVCVCVCVSVCNRGREVKDEGCTGKGRRVKWKEKAISPLSQLAQTPFFCSAEGETFPFLRQPLFPASFSLPQFPITVPLSQQPQLFVCRHCGPPVRWRDGEIEGGSRWGGWGLQMEGHSEVRRLEYSLPINIFLFPWLALFQLENLIKMYLIKDPW